jgi:hypothetical protein
MITVWFHKNGKVPSCLIGAIAYGPGSYNSEYLHTAITKIIPV